MRRLIAASSLTASITTSQTRARRRALVPRGCAPGSRALARPATPASWRRARGSCRSLPSARSTSSGLHVDQHDVEARGGEHLGDAVAHRAAADHGDALDPAEGPVVAASASGACSCDALHRQRHGVAAAQAERGEAGLLAALLQRVEQRDQHARARGADRVPERDRAAVDVDAVPVPAERVAVGQRLRRERLVGLDQVEVADRRRPSSSCSFSTASIGAKNSSFGSPPPVA